MNKWFLGLGSVLLLSGGLIGWQVTTDSNVLMEESVESTQATERSFTILAVGDVMLGRSVNAGSIARSDFTWPFLETAHRLRRADLTIGNLETPILNRCEVTHEGMRFCADSKAVDGLVFAGFDVMSLSNNHTLNYGHDGKQQTEQLLINKNITGVYEEKVWRGFLDGVPVVVIGLDDVSGEIDMSHINNEEGVVIVMIHWGVEYTHEPTARQQQLGRALVDAGVDIVIGSHPHWTQSVEVYKDKLIFYSLGNFIFDQMWSLETRTGAATHITVSLRENEEPRLAYNLLPVLIYDYGQARWY